MKSLYLIGAALGLSWQVAANDVRLVVEKVNNGGQVAGNTYRVWAELASTEQSLHIVWGEETHPLIIESTAPFFQHAYAGHTPASISPALLALDPTVAFDSWVTVGYENNEGNDLWELGVDFSSFNTGGEILANNGAWFLIPSDEKCSPSPGNLVLIAQFTTTGRVTGTMNLQGWNEPHQAWQVMGATFNTDEAQTFGCTDSGATNFRPDATYDNGSCEREEIAAAVETLSAEAKTWEIFPNPLRDGLLHVQFSNEIIANNEQSLLQIMSTDGKLVASHPLNGGAVLPGNRVTLAQDLAAGTYKVILIRGKVSESKTLIVQK